MENDIEKLKNDLAEVCKCIDSIIPYLSAPRNLECELSKSLNKLVNDL